MKNKKIKSIYSLIMLLLFSLINHAQVQENLYLWPNKVPGASKIKRDAIQGEKGKDGVLRLIEVTNPLLTIFKPKPSVNNGIGIIVCPGGGYKILAINKEGYEVAEWLNTLGFTAFVLQYRVPNEQRGTLYDIQRAIRLIRGNTKVWKLNPNKLGVIGFSAGGSLSARVSTMYKQKTYVDIDHFDKLSCRPDFSLLIYPAYLDKGEGKMLTPELKINKNTPPMFIFGTADDPYGNSALVITKALRDANVPVELHMLASGGHGYGLRSGNIAAETWPYFAEIWLRKIITD